MRGSGRRCELLLAALGDDDWRVRKEAATVATRARATRRGRRVALVAALEETINIGLRNAAVEALVAIGPDAVAPCDRGVAALDADARKLAVEVLGGVPDARGDGALVRASKDADVNVVVAAAEALGNAALAGEEARDLATTALVALLGSERHPGARGRARRASRARGAAPVDEPRAAARGPAAPAIRDRGGGGQHRSARAAHARADDRRREPDALSRGDDVPRPFARRGVGRRSAARDRGQDPPGLGRRHTLGFAPSTPRRRTRLRGARRSSRSASCAIPTMSRSSSRRSRRTTWPSGRTSRCASSVRRPSSRSSSPAFARRLPSEARRSRRCPSSRRPSPSRWPRCARRWGIRRPRSSRRR